MSRSVGLLPRPRGRPTHRACSAPTAAVRAGLGRTPPPRARGAGHLLETFPPLGSIRSRLRAGRLALTECPALPYTRCLTCVAKPDSSPPLPPGEQHLTDTWPSGGPAGGPALVHTLRMQPVKFSGQNRYLFQSCLNFSNFRRHHDFLPWCLLKFSKTQFLICHIIGLYPIRMDSDQRVSICF